MKTGLSVLLLVVLLTGCKKETIKYDPQAPDLPQYSEKGLGVGGILINNN